MKLNVSPRAPVDAESTRWFRQIAYQVNNMAEGRQAAFYTSSAAQPAAGEWFLGDFVLNNNPTELGTAGSKYFVHGWRCSVSGTPGTWLQCRFLTGN